MVLKPVLPPTQGKGPPPHAESENATDDALTVLARPPVAAPEW